jgi:hypothetical protein
MLWKRPHERKNKVRHAWLIRLKENAPELDYIEQHRRAPTWSGRHGHTINLDLCQVPAVPELFEDQPCAGAYQDSRPISFYTYGDRFWLFFRIATTAGRRVPFRW